MRCKHIFLGQAFQPEFAEPLTNLTVPIGRDATFRCLVQSLGGYRVSKNKSNIISVIMSWTSCGSLAGKWFFLTTKNINNKTQRTIFVILLQSNQRLLHNYWATDLLCVRDGPLNWIVLQANLANLF